MNDKVDAVKLPRDCATCEFSRVGKHPQEIGKTILQCRRAPPAPVLIGMGGNVATVPMFPILAPGQAGTWCYEWKPKESATN